MWGDIIDVAEEGGIASAVSGETLKSGGLGPCIAIGIFNPIKLKATMLHEANFAMDNELDNILEEVIADLGNKKRLIVHVIGNSISTNEGKEQKEYQIANREYVEDILANYFDPSQVTIEWTEPNNTSELTIEIDEGRFEVNTIPITK